MNEANASEELLKLRKESEDWAVPEYPITDEATRGADDPDDLDMHVWKRDAEYRHFVTSDPDSLWEALECSCDRVLALLERQAKLERGRCGRLLSIGDRQGPEETDERAVRVGKLQVAGYYLTCPICGENIANLTDGSFLWAVESDVAPAD